VPEKLVKQDKIADHYIIQDEIDDIKGSVARVYAVEDLQGKTKQRNPAFKVLRHEHLELPETRRAEKYEAFNREAELLYLLRDNPHVMGIYGLGYLKESSTNPNHQYEVVEDFLRKELNEKTIKQFRSLQSEAMANGWRPYLILECLPKKNSLQYLLTRNMKMEKHGRNFRLPMFEALELTLQLADLLVKLHHQDIIYWDAKPAHAYWNGQKLVLIDWNVSYPLTPENMKRAGGGSETELKELDVLILGRRFIYPAFIGRDFRGVPLESQATPYGSIVKEMHAFFYQGEVSLHGYEDKLDAPVREFLSRVVQSDQFESAEQLRTSLRRSVATLGWPVENEPTNEKMSQYYEKKKRIIANLRTSHDALQEAWWEVRELHKEFPGEDTKYLFNHIRELFKLSEIP
jgi:hypothetical protein